MSDDAESAPEDAETKPRKGIVAKLLIPLVTLTLGGAGFAATYMGIVPLGGGSGKPASEGGAEHAVEATAPNVIFVPVPTVQVPVPGSKKKLTVYLSVSIETTVAEKAVVEHLMPRVLDAFTSFLSSIDAAAYERRGVLEIIRSELVTRTRYVLGEEPVKDLLITEFRVE